MACADSKHSTAWTKDEEGGKEEFFVVVVAVAVAFPAATAVFSDALKTVSPATFVRHERCCLLVSRQFRLKAVHKNCLGVEQPLRTKASQSCVEHF